MSETFLYLTTTGRNSGRAHTIEIWYVEYEGCFVLCSELRENADWVRNIIKQPQVIFAVREREQEVATQNGRATIVEDMGTIQKCEDLFATKYKWNDGLFVQICAV